MSANAVREAEKAIAAAAAEIDWTRPVIIETDLLHTIGLIAMAQLALRHPVARTTPTAKETENFIVKLIEKIDPTHGEVWKLLNRGFNPEWDL